MKQRQVSFFITFGNKRYSRQQKTIPTRLARGDPENPINVSEEDKSDGDGALRNVKEIQSELFNSRRGPKSDTLTHWKTPIATREPGGIRWEFQCKYCNT